MKSLFPNLKVPFLHQREDHYRGELGLDRYLYHVFKPTGPMEFGCYGVYRKDESFIVSHGAAMEKLAVLVAESRQFLQRFRFDPKQAPEWLGRRVEPVCAAETSTYALRPGKGNVPLAGDGGGFMMPLSPEPIGPGIRSGVLVANSISRSVETGGEADQICFEKIDHMISQFRKAHRFEVGMVAAIKPRDHE